MKGFESMTYGRMSLLTTTCANSCVQKLTNIKSEDKQGWGQN